MEEPEFVEKTDPEEVFAALSDDTRIAILRTLWDADQHVLSFSDLREAVGMRDSGRFNYHLGKLVGQFVKQTDGGYTLIRAGVQINGAIEAGAYTVETSLEPIELDSPCASCAANARFGVPPNVLAGHGRETIPSVAGRYLNATFRRITDGFCPFCDGAVDPTVSAVGDVVEGPEELPDDALDVIDIERDRNG